MLKATAGAVALLMLSALALAGVAAYSIASRGLSARESPSRLEEVAALTMRRWATPRAVREQANPVPRDEGVLNRAQAHYADHCASCHANDGSGRTEIGQGLYPKAPDMRAARTQSLTDGELFSIIEHGIRLTGMPAWGNGTPEGERDSWALVHFIRQLPRLTPEDVERMTEMNPRTADQWREDEEARRFLAGEDVPPATVPDVPGHHAGH